MHMALVKRLINDQAFPDSARRFLTTHWGAFLLGSIAPDARVSSGVKRVSTHFFEYGEDINPPAVTAMLNRYPELTRRVLTNEERIAFVAGYAGHLMMDQVWYTDMLRPHFEHSEWADRKTKFVVLHYLLAALDQRDYPLLPRQYYYEQLCAATPLRWLPFMSDAGLIEWRNLLTAQLAPEGDNQTCTILGERIGLSGADLASQITSADAMQRSTWANIPRDSLNKAEEAMYEGVRETVITYLSV